MPVDAYTVDLIESAIDDLTQALPNDDGETFILCRICDDVDSHRSGCPVQKLADYLDYLTRTEPEPADDPDLDARIRLTQRRIR